MTDPPFGSLDYLYLPSDDVRDHLAYFRDVLGAAVVFAVEAMGTRVAAVRLGDDAPLVLLTDHLEGERPVLVYRVDDLAGSLRDLAARGWKQEYTFEIPHGPCCSFQAPGGHRIALYELRRPEAAAHFEGRFDFS